MIDQFKEEVATRRRTGMQTVMIGFSWVVMIVSALLAVLYINNIPYLFGAEHSVLDIVLLVVRILLTGGIAVLIWLKKDEIRTDYEYTFTNGVMDFAQVFNNKKRKNLGTMTLRNITACGMVASGSFNRYINMQGIKRSNWFVNRDADLFYLYFEKEGTKRIIIIEPSEEMVGMIKKCLPQGIYQVN